jgi:hypothetical protein
VSDQCHPALDCVVKALLVIGNSLSASANAMPRIAEKRLSGSDASRAASRRKVENDVANTDRNLPAQPRTEYQISASAFRDRHRSASGGKQNSTVRRRSPLRRNAKAGHLGTRQRG